jgi:hypothetical protein
MQKTRNSKLTIVLILMAWLFPIASGASENPDVAGLIEKHGAALVTVKYVLKVNMGSTRSTQENEFENELTCTMIRADGLIACSNNQMNGFINMITKMSGRYVANMSATPSNFQVIVDSHEQAFDAEITAVDSELDIVWIQITDTRAHSFSFIDFTTDTTADIGDTFIMLRRTSNYFGRTLVVGRNHVGGITEKPRKLYIPGYSLDKSAGLPGFDTSGKVIGIVVTQMPDSTGNTGAITGLMGSGFASFQEGMSGFILPANEMVKATQRAMEVESY